MGGLAVYGQITKTRVGNISELVTNGGFDTDTSGWAGDDATLSVVANRLRVTSIVDYGKASQSITTTIGKTYTLNVDSIAGTSVDHFVKIGTTVGGSEIYNSGETTVTSHSIVFVATSTSTSISVQAGSPTASEYADFDNISVKEKGNIVAYSGFSADNFLEQPYDVGMDYSTSEFNFVFWLKEAANTVVEVILERDSATTAQRITAQVNADGTISFTCDDSTTVRTATSTATVDDGVWHNYLCIYDGTGGVYIYQDGNETPIASSTGAALLTLSNLSATLTIGLDAQGANPLTNGNLSLIRTGLGAPSVV